MGVTDPTLAAARSGDRQAQERLLRELGDGWYRLSLGLLRDPQQAADATQETALRFLTQLPEFRGESQLRTWSMGIAINVVREVRRRRRPAMELRDEADIVPSGEKLPGASLEQREDVERLNEALANLPERQREAVVLRFFEELSTEQTASVMQCAVGTVKATLHQALRRLRENLTMVLL